MRGSKLRLAAVMDCGISFCYCSANMYRHEEIVFLFANYSIVIIDDDAFQCSNMILPTLVGARTVHQYARGGRAECSLQIIWG